MTFQHKEISESFVRQLIVTTIRDYDPSAEVVLFGSRARGTARKDSDWDVLVLVDGESISDQQFQALNYDLWANGLEYGQEINVILHTRKQWNTAKPSLFKTNIINEGIRL